MTTIEKIGLVKMAGLFIEDKSVLNSVIFRYNYHLMDIFNGDTSEHLLRLQYI